jgi:hypothetical protein
MADAGESFMNVGASTAAGASSGAAFGPYGAIIGGGIGMISGMVTEFLAAGQEDEAAKLIAAAYEGLDALGIGKLEQALAQTVPDSELKKIKADPKLKQAQMNALEKIQEVANDPNLTLADQQRVNQVLKKTNRAAQGNNARVLEAMAARGQLNSGASLAAQLQNNQAAAEQANEQGMDIAASAQERALSAMMQGGELAGRMRGQDFTEQAQIGAAQDAINRYNSGAKERAQQWNNENSKWLYGNAVAAKERDLARAQGDGKRLEQGAQRTRETGGQILSAAGQMAGQFAGQQQQAPSQPGTTGYGPYADGYGGGYNPPQRTEFSNPQQGPWADDYGGQVPYDPNNPATWTF